MVIATLKPLPSSPRRFAAGTRTLSKNTAVVFEARIPILSSCGPWVIPPRSRVTAKALIFPFAPGVSGAVLAKTVKKSAMPPLLIHNFCPFKR